MAIVVNQAPQPISWSRNPILYELQADNVIDVAGSAAANYIMFTGPVGTQTPVSISWKGVEIRLLATDTPDSSGGQFPAGDGQAEYVASLVSHFQSNFYINEDFVVSAGTQSGNPALIFTAREVGKTYEFRAVSFNNGSVGVKTAAVNEVRKPNFAIYVEIFVEKNNVFEKVYAHPYDVDKQGKARFDIASIIHAHLEPDLPSTSALFQRCSKSNRRFQLRIGEAWGTVFSIGQMSVLTAKQALLGGTPYEDGPSKTPVSSLQGTTQSTDQALRLGPISRATRPDQPEFLTFMVSRVTAPSTIAVTGVVTFDDNTTQQLVSIGGFDNVNNYETLQFACGFTQLNLAQYETSTKKVTQWRLYLAGSEGSRHSADYVFVLDRSYKPYTRYMMYVNSMGALDVTLSYGKGSETWSFSKQANDQFLASSYKLTDGNVEEFDLSAQVKFEVASGFLPSRKSVRNFADLFLSRWKYRIIKGKYLPIAINTKEIKLALDGDGRHVVSFNYQYRFDSNVLSQETLDGEWFDLVPPPFAGGGQNSYWGWAIQNPNNPDIPAWLLGISLEDLENWNDAFSWGNHEAAGYLTLAEARTKFLSSTEPIPAELLPAPVAIPEQYPAISFASDEEFDAGIEENKSTSPATNMRKWARERTTTATSAVGIDCSVRPQFVELFQEGGVEKAKIAKEIVHGVVFETVPAGEIAVVVLPKYKVRPLNNLSFGRLYALNPASNEIVIWDKENPALLPIGLATRTDELYFTQDWFRGGYFTTPTETAMLATLWCDADFSVVTTAIETALIITLWCDADFSATTTATTPPVLFAYLPSSGTVRLQWTYTGEADSFEIQYTYQIVAWNNLVGVSTTGSTRTLDIAENSNVQISYRLRPIKNGTPVTAWSNVINVIP